MLQARLDDAERHAREMQERLDQQELAHQRQLAEERAAREAQAEGHAAQLASMFE
jgi:F0F1-type ATP synthase assembly protein I